MRKRNWRAEPCGCGHYTCTDWHVAPVAALQGVNFTEDEARAIVELGKRLDEEEQK